MTSRVSFVKLYKETLKHHLASFVITLFIFLVHLISFFMNFQNILEWTTHDTSYLQERMLELCCPNIGNGLVALLIAAYLAFDYFKFMHSKRETDFYESLPLKRKDCFKLLLLCSISIFVVLCTITLGIELMIIFASGYGSLLIFQFMLWNLLCMIGIFFACYVTAVLAMIMTGHSIVAVMGFGVFSAYAPIVLRYLYPAFANTFFDTYVENGFGAKFDYFSPISLAFKLTHNWEEIFETTAYLKYFAIVWIFALVVGVLAFLLFLKRPSESTGRAMAFEKANSPIRIALVIPLALYIGLFLRAMSAFSEDAWLVFGVLFGGFIIHGLMECIFQFDVKALFTKKRQLLISLLFCGLFIAVFRWDLFKFDEYIPDKDDVHAIYITESSMEYYRGYRYCGQEPDGIQGEHIELALAAVEDFMALNENINRDEDIYTDTITFKYELKNGIKKYRRYTYDVSQITDAINTLSVLEDYKNDFCSLYTVERNQITNMNIISGIDNKSMNLTEEQKNHFIDTYLDEFTKLTYTTSYSEPVLIQFECEYTTTDTEEAPYQSREAYPVYKSFVNTLKLLKEYCPDSLQDLTDIEFISLEFYTKEMDNTIITEAEMFDRLKNDLYIAEFNYNAFLNEQVYGYLRGKNENNEIYIDVVINKSVLDSALKN